MWGEYLTCCCNINRGNLLRSSGPIAQVLIMTEHTRFHISRYTSLVGANVGALRLSFLYVLLGLGKEIKPSGAATPGFHFLISAPSVPSLISTEPVELLLGLKILVLRILSALSNKNRKRLKLSCNFCFQICAALPACAEHGDKDWHSALVTIKQGNQHALPNRNPEHNQIETTIHYSFRHVYVLTKNGENTSDQRIDILVDARVIYISQTCGLI